MAQIHEFQIIHGDLDWQDLAQERANLRLSPNAAERKVHERFLARPVLAVVLFRQMAETGVTRVAPLLKKALKKLSNQAPWVHVFQNAADSREHFRLALRAAHAREALLSWHRMELLGKYIPELGDVKYIMTGRHDKGVLDHTLFLLKRWQDGIAGVDELLRDARKDLFLLACLFHDIGKIDGIAEHAGLGAEMSDRIMSRLGYPASDREWVSWMVREHLLFGHVTAGVESTARAFAHIPSEEHLDALYGLVLLDTAAVDERREFLQDLRPRYEEIYAELRRRFAPQLHLSMSAHKIELGVEGLGTIALEHQEELDWVRRNFPNNFLLRFEPKEWPEVARRFQAIREGRQAQAFTANTVQSESTVVSWYGRYTARFLSGIAKFLTTHRINVLNLIAFADHHCEFLFVLFEVTDGKGGRLPEVQEEELLAKLESSSFQHDAASTAIRSNMSLHRVETADSDVYKKHLALTVEAENALGLLKELSAMVDDFGLEVLGAEITTRGESARDTFHLRRPDGDFTWEQWFSPMGVSALRKSLGGFPVSAQTASSEVERPEAFHKARGFLEWHSWRMRLWHLLEREASKVCREQADLIQALLQWTLEQAIGRDDLRNEPWCLLAVGGFGRGFLNVWSDVDIVIYHHEEPSEELQHILESWLRMCTDLHVRVSARVLHSGHLSKLLESDLATRCSVLTRRFIAGSQVLFRAFCNDVDQILDNADRGKIARELIEEREKYEEVLFQTGEELLPEVRQGIGGLRSLHMLDWLSALLQLNSTTWRYQPWVHEREINEIASIEDFLLRVRNEVHFIKRRHYDKLTPDVQGSVAKALGFRNGDGKTAREAFLSRYLVLTRRMQALSRLVAHRLVAASGDRAGTLTPRAGWRMLYTARVSLSPEQREAAFLAFRDLPATFLEDRDVSREFLEKMSHEGSCRTFLVDAFQTGFLHRYLPEYGALETRIPRSTVHTFPVDRHLLRAVLVLDTLVSQEITALTPNGESTLSTETTESRIGRRWMEHAPPLGILRLAVLLHDIDKGLQEGETVHGALANLTKRLGLSAEQLYWLRFLVEHHHLLAELMQFHDIDDPAVLSRALPKIEDERHLAGLALVTLADQSALRPEGIDAWHLGLLERLTENLWALFRKRGAILVEKSEYMQRCLSQATLEAHTEEAFRDFLKSFPENYFRSFTPEEVFHHWEHFHDAPRLGFKLHVLDRKPLLRVVLWGKDSPGLLADLVAAWAMLEWKVVQVQAYTRSDGMAFDLFHLTPLFAKAEMHISSVRQLQKFLKDYLANPKLHSLATARFKGLEPTSDHSLTVAATSVTLGNSNETGATELIIDGLSEDSGLYLVCKTLAELGLSISFARSGSSIDTTSHCFYLVQGSDEIVATDRHAEIKESLEKVL